MSWFTSRVAATAVALLAALVAGCAAAPTAPTLEEAAVATFTGAPRFSVAAAERRWAARGLRDYDYTVRLSCFCFSLPNTIRFQVRDGVSTAPGASAAALARFARLSTIELVFADVRETLERQPYRFGADFHPVLGYPTSYYSDQEVLVADDEVGVSITDLVVR